ncbi:unnamed protein product [Leptosia nina]|uniref:Choline O-acetyltransferase n=1 Tax=Leptosia nina TaxID=320188 RepID=A0AAV1J5N6_9NEOP
MCSILLRIFCAICILNCVSNVIALIRDVNSESPLLTKIIQSIDATRSDDHLYNVTLQLLKSLCLCIDVKINNVKLLERKTNALDFDEIKEQNNSIDVYKKIYNNTCVQLQNQMSKGVFNEHPTKRKTPPNKLRMYDNQHVENILYEALIAKRHHHKYSIHKYSLLRRKSFFDSSEHEVIVIFTINSKNTQNNATNVDRHELKKLIDSNAAIAIDVIDTKYENTFQEDIKRKFRSISECNLYSIYNFLATHHKNNKTRVFKLLRKNNSVKIYLDVVTDQKHDDLTIFCCVNGTLLPSCVSRIYYRKDEDEYHKRHSYRDTIQNIKTLIKLYEKNKDVLRYSGEDNSKECERVNNYTLNKQNIMQLIKQMEVILESEKLSNQKALTNYSKRLNINGTSSTSSILADIKKDALPLYLTDKVLQQQDFHITKYKKNTIKGITNSRLKYIIPKNLTLSTKPLRSQNIFKKETNKTITVGNTTFSHLTNSEKNKESNFNVSIKSYLNNGVTKITNLNVTSTIYDCINNFSVDRTSSTLVEPKLPTINLLSSRNIYKNVTQLAKSDTSATDINYVNRIRDSKSISMRVILASTTKQGLCNNPETFKSIQNLMSKVSKEDAKSPLSSSSSNVTSPENRVSHINVFLQDKENDRYLDNSTKPAFNKFTIEKTKKGGITKRIQNLFVKENDTGLNILNNTNRLNDNTVNRISTLINEESVYKKNTREKNLGNKIRNIISPLPALYQESKHITKQISFSNGISENISPSLYHLQNEYLTNQPPSKENTIASNIKKEERFQAVINKIISNKNIRPTSLYNSTLRRILVTNPERSMISTINMAHKVPTVTIKIYERNNIRATLPEYRAFGDADNLFTLNMNYNMRNSPVTEVPLRNTTVPVALTIVDRKSTQYVLTTTILSSNASIKNESFENKQSHTNPLLYKTKGDMQYYQNKTFESIESFISPAGFFNKIKTIQRSQRDSDINTRTSAFNFFAKFKSQKLGNVQKLYNTHFNVYNQTTPLYTSDLLLPLKLNTITRKTNALETTTNYRHNVITTLRPGQSSKVHTFKTRTTDLSTRRIVQETQSVIRSYQTPMHNRSSFSIKEINFPKTTGTFTKYSHTGNKVSPKKLKNILLKKAVGGYNEKWNIVVSSSAVPFTIRGVNELKSTLKSNYPEVNASVTLRRSNESMFSLRKIFQKGKTNYTTLAANPSYYSTIRTNKTHNIIKKRFGTSQGREHSKINTFLTTTHKYMNFKSSELQSVPNNAKLIKSLTVSRSNLIPHLILRQTEVIPHVLQKTIKCQTNSRKTVTESTNRKQNITTKQYSNAKQYQQNGNANKSIFYKPASFPKINNKNKTLEDQENRLQRVLLLNMTHFNNNKSLINSNKRKPLERRIPMSSLKYDRTEHAIQSPSNDFPDKKLTHKLKTETSITKSTMQYIKENYTVVLNKPTAFITIQTPNVQPKRYLTGMERENTTTYFIARHINEHFNKSNLLSTTNYVRKYLQNGAWNLWTNVTKMYHVEKNRNPIKFKLSLTTPMTKVNVSYNMDSNPLCRNVGTTSKFNSRKENFTSIVVSKYPTNSYNNLSLTKDSYYTAKKYRNTFKRTNQPTTPIAFMEPLLTSTYYFQQTTQMNINQTTLSLKKNPKSTAKYSMVKVAPSLSSKVVKNKTSAVFLTRQYLPNNSEDPFSGKTSSTKVFRKDNKKYSNLEDEVKLLKRIKGIKTASYDSTAKEITTNSLSPKDEIIHFSLTLQEIGNTDKKSVTQTNNNRQRLFATNSIPLKNTIQDKMKLKTNRLRLILTEISSSCDFIKANSKKAEDVIEHKNLTKPCLISNMNYIISSSMNDLNINDLENNYTTNNAVLKKTSNQLNKRNKTIIEKLFLSTSDKNNLLKDSLVSLRQDKATPFDSRSFIRNNFTEFQKKTKVTSDIMESNQLRKNITSENYTENNGTSNCTNIYRKVFLQNIYVGLPLLFANGKHVDQGNLTLNVVTDNKDGHLTKLKNVTIQDQYSSSMSRMFRTKASLTTNIETDLLTFRSNKTTNNSKVEIKLKYTFPYTTALQDDLRRNKLTFFGKDSFKFSTNLNFLTKTISMTTKKDSVSSNDFPITTKLYYKKEKQIKHKYLTTTTGVLKNFDRTNTPDSKILMSSTPTSKHYNYRHTKTYKKSKKIKYNTYKPKTEEDFDTSVNSLINRKKYTTIALTSTISKAHNFIAHPDKRVNGKNLFFNKENMHKVIQKNASKLLKKNSFKNVKTNGYVQLANTFLYPVKKINSANQRKVMKRIRLHKNREVLAMDTKDFFSRRFHDRAPFKEPPGTPLAPVTPVTPNPKQYELRPTFEKIDRALNPRDYFRPKPVIIDQESDFYKNNFLSHHHGNSLSLRERIELVRNNLPLQDYSQGAIENPLYLPRKMKPKFLRDRVDSFRNYLHNSDYVKASESDRNLDTFDPRFEKSPSYFRRRNVVETMTNTSRRPTRRKAITVFFLSPTVPYNSIYLQHRCYLYCQVTEWWLDDMYLKVRLPLPINSSPGMVFPKRHFAKMDEVADLAALYIDDLLDYKEMLDRDELPQERATSREKGQPLCMEQFYRLLGVCRVSGVGKDRLVLPVPPPDPDNCEELVIVACRNYFYAIPVKATDRGRLTAGEIQAQILHALVDAADAPPAPRVGLLTAMNRDDWAKARDQLNKDENNRCNLELLNRALCLICLDEAGGDRPDCDEDTNALLRAMHGSGTQYHSANRWFDKTVQLIISSDGTVGMCYEHSPAEGVAVVRLAERALARAEVADKPKPPPTLLPAPERLHWNLTPELQHTIEKATVDFDRAIKDLDLRVYTYRGYGREYMKSCRTSPDVYIQLALQYTYFKMYGHLVSTYESCSLRRFRDGRVDNIRASHSATLAWVTAMSAPDSPTALQPADDGQKKVSFNLQEGLKKIELFYEAARKQTSIMEANIQGLGTDNHLLGLREAARETLGFLPPLFTDQAYQRMIEFKLSTSQVATTTEGTFMGYGAVVPDGYGCSYNPKKDNVIFCISSFAASKVTGTEAFRQSLEEVLDSMKVMFDSHKSENNQK